LDEDRGNSLMVDCGGDEEVVRDGRKNNNFRKRARYKMLDEGHKTAGRAISSKPLLSQKKIGERKGKDVIKNNRTHVFKNGGGSMCVASNNQGPADLSQYLTSLSTI
jgi:hypothetical protein